MNNFLKCFFLLAFLCAMSNCASAQTQGPEDAASEWQVWTGGGHGINGSQQGTGVWNLGLRYGIVITAPAGPSFIHGQLEYALDAVPVWVIWQKTNTAYGAGLNPFAFKWIFTNPKKIKPYVEIEGGTLFTNTKVPEGTAHVNFTTSAALGAHIFGQKYNWTAEVRFMHISDAGIATPNPGINTIQARIGWGIFRK